MTRGILKLLALSIALCSFAPAQTNLGPIKTTTQDDIGFAVPPANPVGSNVCRRYYNTNTGLETWVNSTGGNCGPSGGGGGPIVGVTQINTSGCPAGNDPCLAQPVDNSYVQISGSFSLSTGLTWTDPTNIYIKCLNNAKIQAAFAGASNFNLWLITGGDNVTIDGCDLGGQFFPVIVTVNNGTNTATLSTTFAGSASGAAGGILRVAGTSSDCPSGSTGPCGDLRHYAGNKITSIVTGTTVNLNGNWSGLSCTSCAGEIWYGASDAIQVNDEECNISSISGSGTIVTVNVASGCIIKAGQRVAIYGTGAASGSTYNARQLPPITITGCTGGSCSFTYPSTLNLGTVSSTGNVGIPATNFHIIHNHIHDVNLQCVAAGTLQNPPQSLMSEFWVDNNNKIERCGTAGVAPNRMDHAHVRDNEITDCGASGTGACVNMNQSFQSESARNNLKIRNNGSSGNHSAFVTAIEYSHNLITDAPAIASLASAQDYIDTGLDSIIDSDRIQPGPNDLFNGGPCVRVEVSKGVSVDKTHCFRSTGAVGEIMNRRNENLGSAFNAATQAASIGSCALASGTSACPVFPGHEIMSGQTVAATPAAGSIQIQDNSGGGACPAGSACYNFTYSAPVVAGGSTCTPGSLTNPVLCSQDTVNTNAGFNTTKLCPNSGAGSCTSAPFPGGMIAGWNYNCSSGGGCINGKMMLMRIPDLWITIGVPTNGITAGDFLVCLSSLTNGNSPEACSQLPEMPATGSVYFIPIELMWPEGMQEVFLDNPGVSTIAIFAKPGGTASSYASLNISNIIADVYGRKADVHFTNNIITQPAGACIGVAELSYWSVTGGSCDTPGYNRTLGQTYPGTGVVVEDNISGASLVAGPPMNVGLIDGIIFSNTGTGLYASSPVPAAIKLDAHGSATNISNVVIGANNVCDPAEWVTCSLLDTATGFAPRTAGFSTLGAKIPNGCVVTGAGAGATCSATAGSNDYAGEISIHSLGGAGVTSSGTWSINYFNSYNTAAFCQATLEQGGWQNTATLFPAAGSITTMNGSWFNSGVNLVSAFYIFTYTCVHP